MKTAEQLKVLVDSLVMKGLGPRPDYDMIDVHATTFIRDGVVYVSAEDGKNLVDYYGEYRGGYPYIDPVLEAFAKEQGMFWEWVNPGCIGLYK